MRNLKYALLTIFVLSVLSCNGERSPAGPTASPDTGSSVNSSVQPFLDPAYPSLESLYIYDWPEYLPSVHDTSYDIYALTVIWGYTFNTGTPNPDTTDWSGTLHINFEGFAEVLAPIGFEPGVDSIIPVNAPVWFPWISTTTGDDFDGYTCVVFFKRGNAYFDAPRVTIEMAPFSTEIYVEELASLTEFHQVDAHNGVIIHSHELPLDTFCPRGTIVGRWLQNSNDRGNGTFEAVWGSRDGTPLGYLLGTFSTTAANGRTFSGWVTGWFTDHIIAWVDGTWWFDDYRMCPLCGESHGVFEGTFEFADGSGEGGTLKGTFGDFNLPPEQTDLPMTGVWRVDCPMATHLDRLGLSQFEK